MVASGSVVRFDAIAQDLFGVMTRFSLVAARGRRRGGDLKEAEFLTLSILHDQGTMIVGDIQRLLGVLPAQMSRIIRALETRDTPLITCRINPRDKRKIDVCLTGAGEKTLLDYKAARVRSIADLLRELPDDDQEELSRLLDKLHMVLERSPSARCHSEQVPLED